MTYLTINKKMGIPPPEPDWVSLFKWLCGCISSLLGFAWGVDKYFKYLKEQKTEANKLLRIEKEEFIRTVVNSSVKLAIADLHSDIQEVKEDQKNINEKILDIYKNRK